MSLEPGETCWTLRDIESGATRATALALSLSVGTALMVLKQQEPHHLVIVRYGTARSA